MRQPLGDKKMAECVHCLASSADTDDHLIPRAWYPDSTPPDIEKWAFPSCASCNGEYSRIEERLLFAFGMCLDPDDALSAGIPARVMRSVNPAAGRTHRDVRARAVRRVKAQREVTFSKQVPAAGVFPNFGPLPGTVYEEYATVSLSVADLSRMVRKFAKGLAYIQNRVLIGDAYIIEYCPYEEHSDPWVEHVFSRFGANLSRGPGTVIHRAAAHEDPRQSLMRIELWGRFKVYAIVTRREAPGRTEGNWLVA
jgi:hypothetical protein